MFCQKCGNQVDDSAKFCEKCGTSLVGTKPSNQEVKVEDNDIVLTVKSKFKILYNSIGFIIVMVMILFFFMFPMMMIEDGGEIILGVLAIFFIPAFIIWAIATAIRNAQYKKYTYDFYKTKVIYKDSFLNVTEKEVKYKYIREIVYTQTFIQRFFNIGNIVLYTNAESGFLNGIFIRSVEDVKDVYQGVKKVINV